jgi:uncharacterized damage-inducible protein DinB
MYWIARSLPLAFTLVFLLSGRAAGQNVAEAVSEALTRRFDTVSGHVLRAAEVVPEESYSYRPTEEVRSLSELFLHVAGAHFAYCAAVSGESVPETARGEVATKAEIVARVSVSRDFCLSAYRGTTGDALGATIDVLGSQDTRAGTLIQNLAHTNLHYGNIVTYMREIGLVPPSSE